jgi:hypothetical protein
MMEEEIGLMIGQNNQKVKYFKLFVFYAGRLFSNIQSSIFNPLGFLFFDK